MEIYWTEGPVWAINPGEALLVLPLPPDLAWDTLLLDSLAGQVLTIERPLRVTRTLGAGTVVIHAVVSLLEEERENQ